MPWGWSGRSARLLAVGLLVVPITLRAEAGVISSDDLFLAPSAVTTGFYPVHTLPVGGTQDYTATDLAGCTGCILTGLQILPILKMNSRPGNVQGVYTPAELAAITVRNYGAFFFRQPNVDYSADLLPGSATVDYLESGQYFVLLHGKDARGAAFKQLFHDEVDDFYLPGSSNPQAPQRVTFTPDGDLALVSQHDPGDNGALQNAADVLTKAKRTVERTDTISDLESKIEKAFKKKGKKIDLVIVGHGDPGRIHIGAQTIGDGIGDTVSVKDFQKKIDPWVRAVTFVSCRTASDAAGATFLKEMRASVDQVGAFSTPVTVGDSYFDQDATGTQLGIPEPGGAAALALAALAWARRRRMRDGAASRPA